MENLMLFVVFAISTWRFTYMLNSEDGPVDIFKRVRIFFGVEHFYEVPPQRQLEILEKLNLPNHVLPPNLYSETFWGSVLSCLLCLSVWVALPHSIILTALYTDSILGFLILFIPITLAISGGSIMVNSAIK